MKMSFPYYLFVHNIFLWFDTSLSTNLSRFLEDIYKDPKLFLFWIKRNFLQSFQRGILRKRIINSGGKFVVLNSTLANELQKLISKDKINIIPFSVFDHELRDLSGNNDKLRLCVPGLLSVYRRDYFSIFNMLESDPDFYKNKVCLDLLGGISEAERGYLIIQRAKDLIRKGYDIKIYERPMVPLYEFDEQLQYADIILGNLHVHIDSHNIYGKSKDSGLMYTMARVGKPGIMPSLYTILPELQSATILFEDYKDLDLKIRDLVLNPKELDLLKEKAKKSAEWFAPEAVYNRIKEN
jgi:hypothetical protein